MRCSLPTLIWVSTEASLLTRAVFCFSSTPLLRTLDLVSLRAAAHGPEFDAARYTEDQPLTPEEQFVVMHSHEEEMNKREKSPSGSDMEVFSVHFRFESSSSSACRHYVCNLFA